MSPVRLLALLLLAAGSAAAQSPAGAPGDDARPAAPPASKSFDPAAIDKSADPCTDFYQFACGNWNRQNPIPADQTRWARSFSLLQERNRYLLWQELDQAAREPRSPLEKQYGDFYAACMDTAQVEKRGLAPLDPALRQIANLGDPRQLGTLLGSLEADGVPAPLFRLLVSQDDKDSSRQIAVVSQAGISLPDRDYYLAPRFAPIRAQYVDHVTKMFVLAGDAPQEAAAEAARVMEIETALARASISRTEMRDPANRYHIYTVSDLQKLAPDFDFSTYFRDVKAGPFETLNVATPEYFRALNGLLGSQPAAAWRSYLRWHVIHGSAPYLPRAFFDENFNFFGRTLSGQKQPEPRWRQCTVLTDRAMGEAVGQEWVRRNFPPEAKASMDKLVAALERSLGDDIRTLPWMSEETRKAAEQKLAMIRNKIGYPENWRSYEGLRVDRADLIGNVQRNAVFERAWNLGHLGKPVDEKEWGMTPPTVNAYYDPSMNDINFPAGILQPPFFDASADPAVNFGGIGVVIGHEMTHGFDDEGSKYDGQGNVREWQTAEDRRRFTERTDCVADEYSGFETAPAHENLPEVKLNGRLTLGENTADNGGLRIAYMALLDTLAAEGKTVAEKIDGYTLAQRYFISFAQVWCQNQTEQTSRQLSLTDPHSPGQWRVNGSVRNFDEFGKAFGCTRGQPMYPVNACRVW